MISACILAKDDAAMIGRVIGRIKPFVQEIIIVDDKSTDNTRQVAEAHGATVFTLQTDIATQGFAAASNEMFTYAKQDWILFQDSDELLGEPEHLQVLTRFPGKTAWALPRRKWFKYPTIREEYEAYPDWQIRFFTNGPQNRFEGHMHIRWQGDPVHYAYRGPHIEHLQQECRTPAKEAQRKALYTKLAAVQGVNIVGGKLKEVE